MPEPDQGPPGPHDDPDFISEEGTAGSPISPYPFARGSMGSPTPVFQPSRSTPLEDGVDEGEGALPRDVQWSMKYLRRARLLNRSEMAIQECFGEGDDAVNVVDDGRKHCLISRRVGAGSDGCTYCLVAQIPVSAYEQLVDGAAPQSAFADAHSFSLCAVYEAIDAVSNVSVAESYDTVHDVPAEYLPPHPPIEFE